MSESAGTVTCTRCGGAVPMAELASSVSCPYCKAHVELARHEVERLVRYRHEVRGRLEAAREQLGHAESWNRWYGGADAKKKNNPLIALGLWLTLVVLVGGMSFAVQALGLEQSSVAKLMPIGVLGAFFLVIGGYLVWFYAGRRSSLKAPALVEARVSCPKCGAPQGLRPGEVLERCRFCSAPLLADHRVIEHGREEAERAVLMAEIERARAERRGMAAVSSSSAATSTPYIIFGSFLPMTALGAIGFTVSFVLGHERDTTVLGILALWLLVFVNVGLLGLVYLYRRNRQSRIDVVVQALLQRFAGSRTTDPWEANTWLDRHWAGSVPIQQLFRGAYFTAMQCSVQGFPVLVVLNPVGASDYYPGFVSVRVGAWLSSPEVAQAHPAIAAARTVFEHLGFALSFQQAGPVALAVHGAARRFVATRDGARLADAIARLALAARELGAKPVDLP